MSSPSPQRRRSTRLSLSRFAYTSASTTPATTSTSNAANAGNTLRPRGRRMVREEDKVKPEPEAKSEDTTEVNTEVEARVKREFKREVKREADLADIEDLADARKRRRIADAPSPDIPSSSSSSPPRWDETYALLKSMRSPVGLGTAYPAPVDTMGCAQLALPTAPPRDQRFQTLIALMLSSQTRDTVTAPVVQRMQTSLPGVEPGLTLENVLAVDEDVLHDFIRPVGFHNAKTRYIKRTAQILKDSFASDIPDTVAGLVSLPGVGPKMAHLCMSAAWGRTEGIGVDVHVHRITNLWGWVGRPTKTPEETRVALEAWLPRERWWEINGLLVGLGQTVCLPVGRRCGECAIGMGGLCRGADRAKIKKAKDIKNDDVKMEDVDDVGRPVKEEVKEEEVEEARVQIKSESRGFDVKAEVDESPDFDVKTEVDASPDIDFKEEVDESRDVKEEDVKEEDVDVKREDTDPPRIQIKTEQD